MYQLKVIRHAEVTQSELDEIVKIKSVAWPYSYEEQLKWIEENLQGNDIHLILKLSGKQTVAYLNLVTIKINVDGTEIDALGVGNVCSLQSGKGYGTELMKRANSYIKELSTIGLLFCKNNLSDFYRKIEWKEVKSNHLSNEVNMFVYNLSDIYSKVEYKGKLF